LGNPVRQDVNDVALLDAVNHPEDVGNEHAALARSLHDGSTN